MEKKGYSREQTLESEDINMRLSAILLDGAKNGAKNPPKKRVASDKVLGSAASQTVVERPRLKVGIKMSIKNTTKPISMPKIDENE